MSIQFQIKETFQVPVDVIYHAWLNSDEHTKMTGGQAKCSNLVNGNFSAWDDYIFGTNIELINNAKIVQSWRTAEFEEQDANSELIIELVQVDQGCALTLTHRNIPDHQPDYERGWIEHYFNPMKKYFQK